MKRLLRAQEGQFTVRTGILLLILAIFVSVSMSYFHVLYLLGNVREKVNESVLAVAALNVPEFYGGSREGDGFARHWDGEYAYIATTISTQDVYHTLATALGAEESGNALHGEDYQILGVRTQFVNRTGNTLQFSTELTVEITWHLWGRDIPVTYRSTVRSSYDAKF